MASYEVRIKPSAVKEIEALPLRDRRRVVTRMAKLAEDPRPPGCDKLTELERYRIRQGNYRILYEVRDQKLVVYVIKVGHRKDVYR